MRGLRPEGPRIAFRADASVEIGTGHVMRCLTLADALAREGAECHFLCRPQPGDLNGLIRARGHSLHELAPPQPGWRASGGPAHAGWLGMDWQGDAAEVALHLAGLRPDWLVVDHYALDAAWEAAMRPYVGRLMVIDDLADRPHVCDLLLDQNLGRGPQDYDEWLPGAAVRLIGPSHMLLRPEFAAHRGRSLARREAPCLRQLLITMGGVDRDNATGRVLAALSECHLPGEVRITVVLGPHAPALTQVQDYAGGMPWETDVRVSVTDMAQLMADADLAIGSGGGTTWERLFMQLPTLVTPIASNQREYLDFLDAEGYVRIFRKDTDLKNLLENINLTSFRVLHAIEYGTGKIVDLLLDKGMTFRK